MKKVERSFWNRFWYDSTGKLSVFESPNIPLLLGLGFLALSKLAEHTSLGKTLSNLEFGLLFVWCWLEITEGNSYFRRLLGLFVLIVLLYSRV